MECLRCLKVDASLSDKRLSEVLSEGDIEVRSDEWLSVVATEDDGDTVEYFIEDLSLASLKGRRESGSELDGPEVASSFEANVSGREDLEGDNSVSSSEPESGVVVSSSGVSVTLESGISET